METKKVKDNVYKITFDKLPNTVLYALRNKDNCVVTDHQITDDELKNIATNPIVIKDYEGEYGIAGKFTDVKDLAIELLNRNDLDFGVVFKSKDLAISYFYYKLDNPTLHSMDSILFFSYGWYSCFVEYGGYLSGNDWGGYEFFNAFNTYPCYLFPDATFIATDAGVHDPVLDKFFKNGKLYKEPTRVSEKEYFALNSYYSLYNINTKEALRNEVKLFLDDVINYVNKNSETDLIKTMKTFESSQQAVKTKSKEQYLINKCIRQDFNNRATDNPFGR